MAKLYQQWGEVEGCATYEQRSTEDALHILNDGSGPILVVADDENDDDAEAGTAVGDPESDGKTESFPFAVEMDGECVAAFKRASDALWFAMQVTDTAAELAPRQ